MEWISVEDELPKNGQRVRVYGQYEGELYEGDKMITAEGDWGSCGHFGVYLPADYYYAAVVKCTHWMPLPPPPTKKPV